MQERGILRFTLDPIYNNIQLEFHNLLVKVNHAKARDFEELITHYPNIHWIKRCKGRWDYILSITARDISDFIDVCREIRTGIKHHIFDTATLISKVHKHRKI